MDVNTMKKFIDPKNPHTVGESAWNLGNHILLIMFVMALLFVVKSSYAEDSFENTIKKLEALENNGTKVEYDKIIAKILAVSKNRTDTRIYVRGDKSINYGRVLEIMGMLSGSGFTKVALISEPYKER